MTESAGNSQQMTWEELEFQKAKTMDGRCLTREEVHYLQRYKPFGHEWEEKEMYESDWNQWGLWTERACSLCIIRFPGLMKHWVTEDHLQGMGK